VCRLLDTGQIRFYLQSDTGDLKNKTVKLSPEHKKVRRKRIANSNFKERLAVIKTKNGTLHHRS